ncbi:MAG: protein-tyrosine kinase, partial [Oscillospiraceae bacterium]|nr:protein-tyrosine kinase [Oscillospiraceae bacterium]
MKDKQTETSAYEIDLLRIVKVLWSKAWIIAVSCILLGAVGFGYARWHVTPMYESSALMYVNNSSISLGGASVTIS